MWHLSLGCGSFSSGFRNMSRFVPKLRGDCLDRGTHDDDDYDGACMNESDMNGRHITTTTDVRSRVAEERKTRNLEKATTNDRVTFAINTSVIQKRRSNSNNKGLLPSLEETYKWRWFTVSQWAAWCWWWWLFETRWDGWWMWTRTVRYLQYEVRIGLFLHTI